MFGQKWSRRTFIKSSSAMAALSAVGTARVSARAGTQETLTLTDLMLKTPREQLLPEVARFAKQQQWTPHQVLGALHQAVLSDLVPRSYLGGEFHSLLMVAPLLGASGFLPRAERWQPVMLGLDYFAKCSGIKTDETSYKRLKDLKPRKVSATIAKQRFEEAMLGWQTDALPQAMVDMGNELSEAELVSLLYRYGARDFRFIGHKVIYVDNTLLTLPLLSGPAREMAMQSLGNSLMFNGSGGYEKQRAFEDIWKHNSELVSKMSENWDHGTKDATIAMLETLREAKPIASARFAFDALNSGQSVLSIFQGCYAFAAELMYRYRSHVVALHSVTTVSSVFHGFLNSRDDVTRRQMVLQAASWMAFFRDYIRGEAPPAFDISSLEDPTEDTAIQLEGLANKTEEQRQEMAELNMGWLKQNAVMAYRQAIMSRVCKYASDIHDFKHGANVLGDVTHFEPIWQRRILSLSMVDMSLSEVVRKKKRRLEPHAFDRDEKRTASFQEALHILA